MHVLNRNVAVNRSPTDCVRQAANEFEGQAALSCLIECNSVYVQLVVSAHAYTGPATDITRHDLDHRILVKG